MDSLIANDFFLTFFDEDSDPLRRLMYRAYTLRIVNNRFDNTTSIIRGKPYIILSQLLDDEYYIDVSSIEPEILIDCFILLDVPAWPVNIVLETIRATQCTFLKAD